MSDGNVWPNKIDLFLHFSVFEVRVSSFLGQMEARWSDQRLLHQHLWDLWYKWTLLIQQRGKRTKDGENVNNFSRVRVRVFLYFQNGPPTQNKCGGSSWCFIGWSNLTKSHCNTMHWKLDNWQTDIWKRSTRFDHVYSHTGLGFLI